MTMDQTAWLAVRGLRGVHHPASSPQQAARAAASATPSGRFAHIRAQATRRRSTADRTRPPLGGPSVVGGLPGAWDQPLGLPVEIVPLDKPYANWVGGVFRAVVLADGKPVPHAEVEIEYLNHEPQIEHRRFDPEGKVTAPQDSFTTLSVRADALGQIIIGLPKAGWWGICALNLDDDLKHEGKELSLDAVLWLKATDMVK